LTAISKWLKQATGACPISPDQLIVLILSLKKYWNGSLISGCLSNKYCPSFFNISHLEKIELDIDSGVEAISRISMIPTLLAVICQSTGMGFAAVARVTENKWIACCVHDQICFGLKAGDELQIETTICNDIRKHQKAIVIDHVDMDGDYHNHPTPEMYGFQSYISMPIIRKNNEFFGTLCALDPKPAKLKTPEVIGMFELFAELISFHLDLAERVEF
jgi:GAF domain-containing protein